MKLLFLGYAVSEAEANEMSGASVAGNTMQLELLRQLGEMPGVEMDVCSLLPVATYPREPRTRIRSSRSEIAPGVYSDRPGFLTLPVLKQPSQIVSLARAASKLARKVEYDYVLTFNMFPHVGVPAWWLKKRFGIQIACLLADPPVGTHVKAKPLVAAASIAFDAWTRRLLLSVDRVIALTSEAARKYTPKAPAIAIDGAISNRLMTNDDARHRVADGEKTVVFAGALTEYNGIIELVEAMRLVKDPSVVLHIYGSGPMSQYINESARTSSNIIYHGKVDSNSMPRLQQRAFLLVNPRQIGHPVSDVTFPSKVLEYMASGTPVLTTRLRCFSADYDGLLYFAETGSSHDLAASIESVASLPRMETQRVAAAARMFVLEHRTWSTAAKRIIQLLSES